MSVIKVKKLTKDYGHNRGVFDVTFDVCQGEVFGFLGPNGAGKTTTIRHIMGFSRPQVGATTVLGLDSWRHHDRIMRDVGYLPGEIALPEHLTGTQFIQYMAELRRMTDQTYAHQLIDRFELKPEGSLKRMSAGMKRKLAIVTAFMHDPAILVLDEPTSALDPVMQDVFVQFVKEEKARGKSILLSSHIFTEIDATCDRISIIKDGRLVSTFVANDLRYSDRKEWKIEFANREEYERFTTDIAATKKFEIASVKPTHNQARVVVYDAQVNAFITELAGYSMHFFSEVKFTLEDYFMEFYDRNKTIGEAS